MAVAWRHPGSFAMCEKRAIRWRGLIAPCRAKLLSEALKTQPAMSPPLTAQVGVWMP
ncbi:hypothetical protein D3C86_1089560 [compost metagenome]